MIIIVFDFDILAPDHSFSVFLRVIGFDHGHAIVIGADMTASVDRHTCDADGHVDTSLMP